MRYVFNAKIIKPIIKKTKKEATAKIMKFRINEIVI
jgi:hypothetical protein